MIIINMEPHRKMLQKAGHISDVKLRYWAASPAHHY